MSRPSIDAATPERQGGNQLGAGRSTRADALWRWLQRAAAIAVWAAIAWGLDRYPLAYGYLFTVVVLYTAVLLRYPQAWLLALPALIPLFNLAPWTGSVFVEEFDFLAAATLAASLWHGDLSAANRLRLSAAQFLLTAAVVAVYLIAFWRGLFPLDPLDANAFSNYFSRYNAVRLVRGMFWGVCLFPAILATFRRHRESASELLSLGVILGGGGTGLVALWERGALSDLLYGQNRYERLHGLLDFSTPYRITGLFSEMHTGGEAIDGYLSLAWPFALLGLFAGRRWMRWLSAAAFPLVLYAALTTFSRGTYLALALGMLALAIAGFGRVRQVVPTSSLKTAIVSIAVLAVMAIAVSRQGGILALVFLVLGFVAAAAAGFFRSRLTLPMFAGGLVAIVTLTITMLARAQITSKWHPVAWDEALPSAVVVGCLAPLAGLLFGRRCQSALRVSEFGVLALVISAIVGIGGMTVMGARMEARFSSAQSDLGTRWMHWAHALALADDDWPTRVFGMGLGAFPRSYLYEPEGQEGGTFQFGTEAGNVFLRTSGGKDLRFSQRVDLQAGGHYRLEFDYRTDAPNAELKVRFCRRQIIYPTEWNPDCVDLSQSITATGGRWMHFCRDFDIGALGDGGKLARAPLMLEVGNRREYSLMYKPPAIVDFDAFSLTDAFGEEHLQNGSFGDAADHWFPLYDFNHLPWHVKNVVVYLLFDTGLAGLLAGGALFLYLVGTSFALARDGDRLGLAVCAGCVSFLSAGLFGTLLDVPRLVLLFFILGFSVIATRQSVRRAHRKGRSR